MDMTTIFELDFFSKVKCHPYRTATVGGTRFILNREAADIRLLEAELAKKAGVSQDNHVVYEVSNPYDKEDPAPLYFWCTDFKIYVGTKIREERW